MLVTVTWARVTSDILAGDTVTSQTVASYLEDACDKDVSAIDARVPNKLNGRGNSLHFARAVGTCTTGLWMPFTALQTCPDDRAVDAMHVGPTRSNFVAVPRQNLCTILPMRLVLLRALDRSGMWLLIKEALAVRWRTCGCEP